LHKCHTVSFFELEQIHGTEELGNTMGVIHLTVYRQQQKNNNKKSIQAHTMT